MRLTHPERKALYLTVAWFALVGAAGIFFGYANPFYQIPPLALLFPACLASFGRLMPTGKSSFFAGWLCATLGNSACLYWLCVPMHDFGLLPWVATLPPLFLLSGFLGLYGGIFSLCYRFFRKNLPFYMAVSLSTPLWAALEILKGTVATGFPWISLSTAFFPWPVWIQGASLVGSYALSGIFAGIAVALSEASPIRAGFSFATRFVPRSRRLYCFAAALLPAAVLYAYGAWILCVPLLPEKEITTALIQGNIDQNQKWEPTYQHNTVTRYLNLSSWALSQVQDVDLIVWPETAMPFYLETNAVLAGQIDDFAKKFSVPIAFGAPGKTADPAIRGYYNRLWLQIPGAPLEQHYDKSHLVPFGEYIPFNLPLTFIEYLSQGVHFIPAEKSAPLQWNVVLGAMICYEAIFPEQAQMKVAEGATILLNVSNDAWFGKTAAPLQHLHLAGMRAVEQRRFLMRATNTGISAIITPQGRIAVQGSLFRAEAVIGRAGLMTETTLYHRIANWLTIVIIVLPFSALLWCLFRSLIPKRHPRLSSEP